MVRGVLLEAVPLLAMLLFWRVVVDVVVVLLLLLLSTEAVGSLTSSAPLNSVKDNCSRYRASLISVSVVRVISTFA